MEDDGRNNNSTDASQSLPPASDAPKQQSKQPKKASSRSKKTNNDKKKSFRRSWQSSGPVAKWTLRATAIGATAALLYFIAYIVVSCNQARQTEHIVQIEHAPLVIHSRPPELLMPFTCDPKEGLRTGNMQSFVKNIGNATAYDVNPFLFNETKIVPEKKTGHASFDDPPVGDCGAPMDKTPMDFPLPPGIEKSPQIRQSVMTAHALNGEKETVQFYYAECVYYSDDSAVRHATCDTYRLYLPSSDPLDRFGGTPIFACDGTPRTGKFTESIGGHCQK